MIYDVMLKRRSIRKFKKETPGKKILAQLVSAASSAPSASNKQPWRFIITSTPEVIQTVCNAVNTERKSLIPQVEEDFRSEFAKYSENFSVFQHAPVLIIPIYRSFPMLSQIFPRDAKPETLDHIKKLENNSALISISCAIQNILLMAEDIGLGACCMTGPLIAANQIKEIFSIQEGWEPAALLAVGYADEKPSMPVRKPVDSILKWFT